MTTMNTVVKGIEVDHINGVIVVTKAFLKLAKNPSTEEFAILINIRKECPTYIIVERKIDTNDSKESYGGLSIEKMLAYVCVFEKEKLSAFEDAVRVYVESNGKVQKGKYATVKKVFLKRFKDSYLKRITDVNNVVKIDEKAKELKEKSKGLVAFMLSERNAEEDTTDKVVDITTPQKKVVNE